MEIAVKKKFHESLDGVNEIVAVFLLGLWS